MSSNGHIAEVILPYFPRQMDADYRAVFDRTRQKGRICTITGPQGCGKTALYTDWVRCQMHPEDIITVYLDLPTQEYRSMTHMVLARLLEGMLERTRPVYAPVWRRGEEETNQRGRKPLEALRKRVCRELRERPIQAIIIDRIEYMDYHAFSTIVTLCRENAQRTERSGVYPALFFVGQSKKQGKETDILLKWMNTLSETIEYGTERIVLTRPTVEEMKGTKNHPGYVRRFFDALHLIVPDTPDKSQVMSTIGALFTGTAPNGKECNMASVMRLVHLFDDEADDVPNDHQRHITANVVKRVTARLKVINPSSNDA